MNPLLENFLKRPGIIIIIADEWFDDVSFTSVDPEYNAWLESLIENVDYKIDDKKILLNPNSSKIQRIKRVTVDETLKNLDTSILNVKQIVINAPILENLIVGNVTEGFAFNVGSPSSIVFTGDNYNNIYINSGDFASIEAKKEDAFKNVSSFSFTPNSLSMESNKKKIFLRRTLRARSLTIKQSIVDDLDDDDLKSQINTKMSGGSYSYYYSNDLIGNVPEVDYKYFLNAVDTNWEILANWFEDADGLIPALSLPSAIEYIYIGAGVTVTRPGELFLRNATVFGTVSAGQIRVIGNSQVKHGAKLYGTKTGLAAGLDLNTTPAVTFEDTSENYTSDFNIPIDAYVSFRNAAINFGQVPQPKFYGTSQHRGIIYGNAFFYDYASTASGSSIYGDGYFYGASKHQGQIYNKGYFYDYAQNTGNILSGAEFDGIALSQAEYIERNPNFLFYNETFKQGNRFSGCLNNGFIGGITDSTTFKSSAVNIGSTGNDTYCYDDTRVYSINVQQNKNLYFYDNGRFFIEGGNSSNITGDILKHFNDFESLSAYISDNTAKYVAFCESISSFEFNNAIIYGGVSAVNITLNNSITENNYATNVICRLIGNVTFNTTLTSYQDGILSVNMGSIKGNTIFNDYSINIGDGNVYDNRGNLNLYNAKSRGYITGNVEFNDYSENSGIINGIATFRNNSKNRANIGRHYPQYQNTNKIGAVLGDAYFYNQSSNSWGLIGGFAHFYDDSCSLSSDHFYTLTNGYSCYP